MRVTIDENGSAYIALSDVGPGGVAHAVPLAELASDTPAVAALRSLVLDFDGAGRLVGIEVAGDAEAVLPESVIEAAERL